MTLHIIIFNFRKIKLINSFLGKRKVIKSLQLFLTTFLFVKLVNFRYIKKYIESFRLSNRTKTPWPNG